MKKKGVRQGSLFLRRTLLRTHLLPPALPVAVLLLLARYLSLLQQVSGSGSGNVGVFIRKVWSTLTLWDLRRKLRRNMKVSDRGAHGAAAHCSAAVWEFWWGCCQPRPSCHNRAGTSERDQKGGLILQQEKKVCWRFRREAAQAWKVSLKSVGWCSNRTYLKKSDPSVGYRWVFICACVRCKLWRVKKCLLTNKLSGCAVNCGLWNAAAAVCDHLKVYLIHIAECRLTFLKETLASDDFISQPAGSWSISFSFGCVFEPWEMQSV